MKANNMKQSRISRKITLDTQGEKGNAVPANPVGAIWLIVVTVESTSKKREDLSVGRNAYPPKFICSESGLTCISSTLMKSG
jgi:hypothetical protein